MEMELNVSKLVKAWAQLFFIWLATKSIDQIYAASEMLDVNLKISEK